MSLTENDSEKLDLLISIQDSILGVAESNKVALQEYHKKIKDLEGEVEQMKKRINIVNPIFITVGILLIIILVGFIGLLALSAKEPAYPKEWDEITKNQQIQIQNENNQLNSQPTIK